MLELSKAFFRICIRRSSSQRKITHLFDGFLLSGIKLLCAHISISVLKRKHNLFLYHTPDEELNYQCMSMHESYRSIKTNPSVLQGHVAYYLREVHVSLTLQPFKPFSICWLRLNLGNVLLTIHSNISKHVSLLLHLLQPGLCKFRKIFIVFFHSSKTII